MPVEVFVLYNAPEDPDAFDAHYVGVHVPLVKRMPNLVQFEVSTGPVDVQGGDPCHLIARLRYASQGDLEASLASPEGQIVVMDLGNFASAGVTLVTAEMRQA